MKKLLLSMIVLSIIMLLAACGGQEAGQENIEKNDTDNAQHEEQHTHPKQEMVGGDIRETTVSVDTLPTFLEDYHEDIVGVYSRVPEYQELLEHIPCYCGCEPIGHGHVYHCFINENNEDGSLVWDNHGAKCGVCLETAYASMNSYEDGTSMLEIREMVDATFQDTHPNPTPTPMPGE